MSLGAYFVKKCTDNIIENLALLQMKLSDPGNLVTFELSGKLVDAASGGLGPLSSFAGEYLRQNTGVVLIEALQATGLEDTAQQAFNLANNILAASIMANNELVMYFVRRLATNTITLLREKQEILAELSSKVTELYNLLKILTQGNPVYDPYIAQLRRALLDVRSARTDLLLVRNTFVRRDLWLSRRFDSAKASLERARSLVTPPLPNQSINRGVAGGTVNKSTLTSVVNNPLANGTTGNSAVDAVKAGQIAAIGLFENPPVPTTEQQVQATISIPKVSKQVIEAAEGYFEIVVNINARIAAFISALSQMTSGLPAYYKKYILSLFDPLLNRVDNVAGSMADILNGSPTAFAGPIGGFKPQPLTASVQAFKWGMDLSIILENFKTIPTGQFTTYVQAATIVAIGTAEIPGALAKVSVGANQILILSAGLPRTPKQGDRITVLGASIAANNVVTTLARVHAATLSQENDVVLLTLAGRLEPEYPTFARAKLESPSGALDALNISQQSANAYQTAVVNLKKLDDIKIEGAVFRATDAQEQTAELESQLLVFLLEANNAPISATVRTEVLGVARSVLKRLAITVSRDNEIAAILQRFVDTPFELEDTIKKIGDGIFALLQSAGLDNAQELLESGDFNKFFKLNSKEATFVGAALASVALLKQCFPDQASRDKLSQIEFELEKDADLLNIQFSIDFDLAIFKNLQDCLRFNSLGGSFSIQEAFCGIISSSGVGQSLARLKDVLSF
jgi:hypothetical protein